MNAIIENRKTLKKAKLVSPNIQDIFVDEYDACKRRIRDGIRRRLKFSPSELSDKKEAVRVFADDLEKLTKMHRQWCELVTVLARTHCKTKGLETLPPPLRKELTFGLNSAFAKAKRAGFKRANCLGAELLKGNSETVVAALIASLRNMTYDLVEEVFEGLEFLKNECILGKITWTHDDACFFDHWNHSVEAEGFHEDTRKTQYVRRPVQEDNLDVLWVNVETKTTSREGKYIHRAEQLEQHLMGAERSSLKNCKAIIPRQLNPIVEKIPQFLRSEIVVVTGEQFVVNRDRKSVV